MCPGLGWKVFSRYPEEFIHPDAPDLWRILAAFLYTSGFSPARIAALLTRHVSIFACTVRDPDNLRRLFGWLAELGLDQASVLRMVDRHPLLLQTSVEGVLRPRLEFMRDLGLPLPRVLAAVRRQPELLGVDSSSLVQRADYLLRCGRAAQQRGSSPSCRPRCLRVCCLCTCPIATGPCSLCPGSEPLPPLAPPDKQNPLLQPGRDAR